MTDISQVRTVYDAKSLHRALADVFRDDELKRIPLLRRGQRLAQGSTYYDLCEGRELTALGTPDVWGATTVWWPRLKSVTTSGTRYAHSAVLPSINTPH